MESLKKQLVGLTQFEVTKMIGMTTVSKLGLNSSERIVLITLSMHIDKNYQCYPSHERLVDVTALSESTIKRAIKKLTSIGYINKERRKSSSGSTVSNLYTLDIKKINGGEKASTKNKVKSNVIAFDSKRGFVKN